MRVLLFEQFDGGHYSNYLDCLIPALLGMGEDLVVAANKTALESFLIPRWGNQKKIDFFSLPGISPVLSLRDRIAASYNLLVALKALEPDFTILPSADAQATMFSLPNALSLNRLRKFGLVEGTFHAGYGYSAVNRKQKLKETIYSSTSVIGD